MGVFPSFTAITKRNNFYDVNSIWLHWRMKAFQNKVYSQGKECSLNIFFPLIIEGGKKEMAELHSLKVDPLTLIP